MQTVLIHNSVRYPARLSRVSFTTRSTAPFSMETTHTASIPVNQQVKRNDTLEDADGAVYRVMSARVILGKLRLELKLQY